MAVRRGSIGWCPGYPNAFLFNWLIINKKEGVGFNNIVEK